MERLSQHSLGPGPRRLSNSAAASFGACKAVWGLGQPCFQSAPHSPRLPAPAGLSLSSEPQLRSWRVTRGCVFKRTTVPASPWRWRSHLYPARGRQGELWSPPEGASAQLVISRRAASHWLGPRGGCVSMAMGGRAEAQRAPWSRPGRPRIDARPGQGAGRGAQGRSRGLLEPEVITVRHVNTDVPKERPRKLRSPADCASWTHTHLKVLKLVSSAGKAPGTRPRIN